VTVIVVQNPWHQFEDATGPAPGSGYS
jgi:hypothetical protein